MSTAEIRDSAHRMAQTLEHARDLTHLRVRGAHSGLVATHHVPAYGSEMPLKHEITN